MRALPRATASPAFRSRVLRAVHEEPRPTRFAFRFAAAFAMAVCLIAVVQVAMMQHDRRTRMEALRLEQKQIQAELQAVKQRATDNEPVVVLENDRGTRVVMDYDSAVQPASYQTFD
jgi:hypothetical protein